MQIEERNDLNELHEENEELITSQEFGPYFNNTDEINILEDRQIAGSFGGGVNNEQ